MRRIFLTLLLIFAMIPGTWASVAGDVNKANDLYSQGKFDDSLGLYQKALDQDDKSPVVKYDLGTAFYKKGDYAKALEYLEQASQDKNIKIKPKAEYNLGNVLYKSGIQKENINVDQAIKSLQEALGQYIESVRDDPKDSDAKFNQDIVKKEIERLKQKKQEQQKQQDKQQQQNQKQQPQDQQNKQSQQGRQNQQKQQEEQPSQQKNLQDQKNQQSSARPQDQKEKNAKDQADESQKEYDRKQAEDLLEDYQENEEPKKLLSYMPKKIDDRPVLKDW